MTNIQKLLFLGSTRKIFEDLFTGTVSPASGAVTNLYNNWNYQGKYQNTHDMVYPYINNSFYAHYGSSGSVGQINRSKEKYSLNRAMDISYSFNHTWGSSNGTHEISLGGDTTYLPDYLGNYPSKSVPSYGGLTVWGYQSYGSSSVTLKVANNKTNIATIGSYACDTTWYVFLKLRGNTLYYAVNSTGAIPSSFSSVAITDKTVSSESLIMLVSNYNGPDYAAQPIALDNLKITMY